MKNRLSLLLPVLVSLGSLCRAEVALNGVFQDDMILQRDKPVAVWGKADVGESIMVSIANVSSSTTADGDGKWLLYLDPVSADGIEHTLTIQGASNTVVRSNILYGDVYLGSGQSNMSLLVRDLTADAKAALSGANIPRIRLCQVPAFPSTELKEDVRCKWELCNTESAHGFSALLYFFGRDLYEKTEVPIGLISASFGGSYIHAWHPNLPDVEYSSVCYNSMIAPLMPFTVNAILWYQGESDAGSSTRSALWGQRYLEMIQLWREGFQQPDLPFICTQLANYQYLYLYIIRQAQYESMDLPNAGCTTAVDLGETDDIHPMTKDILGPRFGLWVRKFLYGEDVAFTGPLWESATKVGRTIEVRFAYVGSGLIAEGGSLEAFEIAGADEDYEEAVATIISSNTVRISAASVSDPVWVRYAWAADPAITLYGGDELPALPFLAEAGTTGPMPSFDSSLVNTNPPPEPLQPKPYAWGNVVLDLNLNENSGSTAGDRSGFNNDGTVNGAVWTTGRAGSALSFGSDLDYIEVPYSASLEPESFTAAAWIKLDETGAYMNIMSCLRTSYGWKFLIDRSNPILSLAWFENGELSTDILRSITPLESNTWYHVALTVENGGTVAFYLNGTLDCAATMTSSFFYGHSPLEIAGKGSGWYGGAFKGTIDDVFFGNSSLTASQVADLADGIRPAPVQLALQQQAGALELSATNLSVHALNRLQISTNLTEGWSDYSTISGTTATNWTIPMTNSVLMFRVKAE